MASTGGGDINRKDRSEEENGDDDNSSASMIVNSPVVISTPLVASGIIALVRFALQMSESLYSLLNRLPGIWRHTHELELELKSLQRFLEILQQVAEENKAQLEHVRLPLFRCGRACREFEELISKYARAHMQEWGTTLDLIILRYDIMNFELILNDYTAIIRIVLGGATL